MPSLRSLRTVLLVCAPLALVAIAPVASGCSAPADAPTESSHDALTLAPIHLPIPPVLAPAPKYFTAGPNETIQLTPYAGYMCMLQRISGAFDYLNLPAIRLYAQNGSYWLAAGVNTTAEAVCVDWGAFNGAALGSNLFMSTQIVVPTSADESITGYKIATLDVNPGDACFLMGIHGDWLTNEREPAGLYTRVNGAWAFSSGGEQSFEVLSNGVGAGGDAFCYDLPGGKAFKQSSYTAQWYGPTSTALPSASTAICGLTGIQGGLDNFNDAVAIVQNADGSQTLALSEDPYDTLWASATCIPYAQ